MSPGCRIRTLVHWALGRPGERPTRLPARPGPGRRNSVGPEVEPTFTKLFGVSKDKLPSFFRSERGLTATGRSVPHTNPFRDLLLLLLLLFILLLLLLLPAHYVPKTFAMDLHPPPWTSKPRRKGSSIARGPLEPIQVFIETTVFPRDRPLPSANCAGGPRRCRCRRADALLGPPLDPPARPSSPSVLSGPRDDLIRPIHGTTVLTHTPPARRFGGTRGQR